MELRIINRHGEVSDTLRTYVEKKMKKFDRLLTDAQGVDRSEERRVGKEC